MDLIPYAQLSTTTRSINNVLNLKPIYICCIVILTVSQNNMPSSLHNVLFDTKCEFWWWLPRRFLDAHVVGQVVNTIKLGILVVVLADDPNFSHSLSQHNINTGPS